MINKFNKYIYKINGKLDNLSVNDENKKNIQERINKYKPAYLKEISKSETKKLREYYATKFNNSEINNYQIIYETRDGANFTDSPRAIYEYIINDDKFRKFNHIVVVDKKCIGAFVSFFDEMPENVSIVYRNSFEYVDALLESKYLFNNSTFQNFFVKKEQQIYINTWHGTPLKKMGIDFTQDSPRAMTNVRRNMLMSDFLISPNEHVTDIFLRAYHLDYTWQGTILEGGLPRTDNLFNKDKEKMVNFLLSEDLIIDKNKKNIVYMPTWKERKAQKGNDLDILANQFIKFIEKFEASLSVKYNILIKVHPFEFSVLKNNIKLKKHLISDSYDANDILSITDVLITDFSSVFFDYLPTGKPVYFYMWDADLYNNERGIYFDSDKLPGPVSYDIDKLIEDIKNESSISYEDRYLEWQNKFTLHEDGNVTKRYVDYIFEGKKSKNIIERKARTGKKKLLIFRGKMGNNGVTSSLINLLKNIDKDKFDITLFLMGSLSEVEINNINKLDKSIRKVFYMGAPIYTLDEYAINSLLKEEHVAEEIDELYPNEAYKREVKRIFGNQNFDIAIDFSGYSYFFAKYIIATDANKKLVFLHSDLFEETIKREAYANDLQGIFQLYKKFDIAVSVSNSVRIENGKKLNSFLSKTDHEFLPNIVDISDDFNKCKNNVSVEKINIISDVVKLNEQYLRLYKNITDIKNNISYIRKTEIDNKYIFIAKYILNNDTFYKILENYEFIGWVEESILDEVNIDNNEVILKNNVIKNNKAYIETSVSFVKIFTGISLQFKNWYYAYLEQYKSIIFDINSFKEKDGIVYVNLMLFDQNIGWIEEKNLHYISDEKLIDVDSDSINVKLSNDHEYKKYNVENLKKITIINTKIQNNKFIINARMNKFIGEISLDNEYIYQDVYEYYMLTGNLFGEFKEGRFFLIKKKVYHMDGISLLVVINGKEVIINESDLLWDKIQKPINLDIIMQIYPVSYFVTLKPGHMIYCENIPNSMLRAQSKIKTDKLNLNAVYKVSKEITASTGFKYFNLIQDNQVIGYINKKYTNVETYDAYLKSPVIKIDKFNLKVTKNKRINDTNIKPLNIGTSYKLSEGLLQVIDKDSPYYSQRISYHGVKHVNDQKYYEISCDNKNQFINDNQVKVTYSNYLSELSLNITDSDIVFSTVGRLSLEKNQEALIRAIGRIIAVFGKKIKLLLIGEGPLRNDLEKLIKKLKLQYNVFLVGQKENIAHILKQTNYFICPSLYEGQGMALIEAISIGVPSIGSKIPAIMEILGDNEYGLIADGTTPEALYEAIYKILVEDMTFNKFDVSTYNLDVMDKFNKLIE